MPMKKIIIAIVACYVFLSLANFLVHGVWLNPEYMRLGEVEETWRDFEQMQKKMWIMYIGSFLFVAAFVWVYSRGVENKPWMGQGIRYGICIAFLYFIPIALSEYVLYRIPYMLAIKWMVAGSIISVILGIIVAAICRKDPARA